MTKLNDLRFISDDGHHILIGEAERIFEREHKAVLFEEPKVQEVPLFEGRSYIRSTDGAMMTERSPHQFVNVKTRT